MIDKNNLEMLSHLKSELPLSYIHNFNQLDRDEWMKLRASEIKPGSKVLDVGAGTCPYRNLFSHCEYKTHDFKKYDGVKLGGGNKYGDIDYVSDLGNIPVADESFDVIVCTEVLEHVPDPADALREMTRIIKKGGRLILTAPLGSGLHQLPFHFYGGFTPEWYRHFAGIYGLEVCEIKPNGGFFRFLAQECIRVSWLMDKHWQFHGKNVDQVNSLFAEILPRFLFALEEKQFIDQFTIGYNVVLDKPNEKNRAVQSSDIENTAVVIFSKDRPMQLDATLRSMFNLCEGIQSANVKVIYKSSDATYFQGYETLKDTYHTVEFFEESNFKEDLIKLSAGSKYLLFLVDDCVFIRNFKLSDCIHALSSDSEAIGVSLRLGRNTRYCYTLDKLQEKPAFNEVKNGLLYFNWVGAECDFGYPLELSSSLYRTNDLIPLLEGLPYSAPNNLEDMLSRQAPRYANKNPRLYCYAYSVAFCMPMNRVQNEYLNRTSGEQDFSPEQLVKLFNQGYRVDVKEYEQFLPNGCHQEVKIKFIKEV